MHSNNSQPHSPPLRWWGAFYGRIYNFPTFWEPPMSETFQGTIYLNSTSPHHIWEREIVRNSEDSLDHDATMLHRFWLSRHRRAGATYFYWNAYGWSKCAHCRLAAGELLLEVSATIVCNIPDSVQLSENTQNTSSLRGSCPHGPTSLLPLESLIEALNNFKIASYYVFYASYRHVDMFYLRCSMTQI